MVKLSYRIDEKIRATNLLNNEVNDGIVSSLEYQYTDPNKILKSLFDTVLQTTNCFEQIFQPKENEFTHTENEFMPHRIDGFSRKGKYIDFWKKENPHLFESNFVLSKFTKQWYVDQDEHLFDGMPSKIIFKSIRDRVAFADKRIFTAAGFVYEIPALIQEGYHLHPTLWISDAPFNVNFITHTGISFLLDPEQSELHNSLTQELLGNKDSLFIRLSAMAPEPMDALELSSAIVEGNFNLLSVLIQVVRLIHSNTVLELGELPQSSTGSHLPYDKTNPRTWYNT